ncbi:MAG: transglycosylase SLT domain-containing protein [Nitrospira sp.]|nr:transglycosylase SLT domain-containing protein [Nitrospira sp.]
MLPSLSKRLPKKPELFRAATIVGKSLAACAALLSLIAILWWTVPGTQTVSPSNSNLEPKTVQRAPDPVASGLPLWERIRFRRHIETRLPQYRRQFEGVAKAYKISWTLLAAQAYQESRWDPHAVSPTGVRGIMMLTRDTASSLGIQNRTDPTKSIVGGARYFRDLEKQLPRRIGKTDRIAIALAAYNVGMGHIKDAQFLARQMGKNPHSWDDLKTTLPLLAKKSYHETLQYGYARGWEPVRYVKRIRAYHSLLEQHLRQV